MTPTTAATSVVLESDHAVPPRTKSAVCLEPFPDAPAAMFTPATLELLLDRSSVERPLVFAATSNVEDDNNLVTGRSPVPLTLATLGVDDSHVATMYNVLWPFNLLVPLSKSKEPYLSSLLPQFTQAMVRGGISLNQFQAKYSGTSSDLGCASATTHLILLLPWDPGEKTRISRNLAICRVSTLASGVNELTGNSSGDSDHLTLHTSESETATNVLDTGCYLLHHGQKVQTEQIILVIFSQASNLQSMQLGAQKGQCSSRIIFMPEHAIYYGTDGVQWEIAWLLVFLPYAHSIAIDRKAWQPPLSIHGSVPSHQKNAWFDFWLKLLLFKNDRSLEAWICCHTTRTCWMNKHMELTVEKDTIYGVDTWEVMSYVPVHGHELPNGFHHEKLWDPGGFYFSAWISQWRVVLVNCKSRLGGVHSTNQQSTFKAMAEGRSFPWAHRVNALSFDSSNCFYTVVHWVIPSWVCTSMRTDGNQCMCVWRAQCLMFEILVGATSSQQDLIVQLRVNHKFMAHIFPTVDMLSRVHPVQLLNQQSISKHAIVWQNKTVWFNHSATVAMVWSIQLLEFLRNSDQDDNFRPTGFAVHCLDYCNHRELGEVMKHQVPWDPGGLTWRGLTWHRLEVKPKFKEGGMLATILYYHRGLGHVLPYWAWASQKSRVAPATYTGGWRTTKAAWIRTASASSLLSLLPPVILFLPF